MEILYFILPALFILLSSFVAVKFVKRGANKKKAVLLQVASVAFVMVVSIFSCASEVSAADVNSGAASTSASTSASDAKSSKATAYGVGLIAAALVTGLSGIGGGIAVASAAPAAIAATSEDPKAFGKALIFVALGEGIALYGLLVSILIFGKIDSLIA